VVVAVSGFVTPAAPAGDVSVLEYPVEVMGPPGTDATTHIAVQLKAYGS
jgi:hypothetical protein